MAVVVTSIVRIKDWNALRVLNRETLIRRLREVGATRYRLYRNARDASQALVVAEFPDEEAVHEFGQSLGEEICASAGEGTADDRIWEATEFEAIGE